MTNIIIGPGHSCRAADAVASVVAGDAIGAIICARVEDIEPLIPDQSVHLMPTDGPYHEIKDSAWDCEHETREAFLAWKAARYQQWRRILAPNGTIYDFASSSLGARTEILCAEYFNVLCNIRWAKPSGRAGAVCIQELRKPFPQSETIIMAEHHHSDRYTSGELQYNGALDKTKSFIYEPLRTYFHEERQRSKLSSSQIQEYMHATTGKRYVFDRHAFSVSQWELPTEDQYAAARAVFNLHGDPAGRPYFVRQYEDLRRQYEDLRRPFTISPRMPVVDTWNYDVVQAYDGKHECEKPAQMGADITHASSRPNDLVLVLFAGSGCFAAAAAAAGRRFIAVEYDEYWARATEIRCKKSLETRTLQPAPQNADRQRAKSDPRQVSMFGD